MNSRIAKWSSLVVAVLIVAFLSNFVRADDDTNSLEGKAAPDLSMPVLGTDKTVKLSEQKGSVVMIDFWATWCPPCRASLPHVQKLSADKDLAGKGLKVWAANAHEEASTAQDFMKEKNFTFTAPAASEADMQKYMIRGIPTTVIVGKDGNIAKVFVGYGGEASDKMIEAALDEALKAPAPAK